ncbi:MAG: hypothetical protein B6245_05305 [Desulfobacteraceae bacterium 4572_88]|nr:MAG: hypothetical protein B6245_05305 [Desulfobacteraceae bacterium 4572_88]
MVTNIGCSDFRQLREWFSGFPESLGIFQKINCPSHLMPAKFMLEFYFIIIHKEYLVSIKAFKYFPIQTTNFRNFENNI